MSSIDGFCDGFSLCQNQVPNHGHGVEDSEQLVHGGHASYLLRFALLARTFVESTDGGVVADRGQRGRVKDPAHGGATAPDMALSPELAAVPVERCDTNQAGQGSVAELLQLRQVSRPYIRRDRTDACHTAQ